MPNIRPKQKQRLVFLVTLVCIGASFLSLHAVRLGVNCEDSIDVSRSQTDTPETGIQSAPDSGAQSGTGTTTSDTCNEVLDSFIDALSSSEFVDKGCVQHVGNMPKPPEPGTLSRSAVLRTLMDCEREEKHQRMAFGICNKKGSGLGSTEGFWDVLQAKRVYMNVTTTLRFRGPPSDCLMACCKRDISNAELVGCIKACKPKNFFEHVPVTDPDFTRVIYRALNGTAKSAIDFGSGKGNWMSSMGKAGLETVVGIEPSFMGSLAFYTDSWDSRYQAVQLDAIIGSPAGDLRAKAFACERFGRPTLRQQFDLVWTVEVFEHIPLHLHCELLNTVAGFTRDWAYISIAYPGQPGNNHIAGRPKDEWIREWEARGFKLSQSPTTEELLEHTIWKMYKRNVVLMRRSGPLIDVDCSKQNPTLKPQK